MQLQQQKKKLYVPAGRLAACLSELRSMSVPKLRRAECCKESKRFKSVDFECFIDRPRFILTELSFTRRVVLHCLPSSNNNYFLSGRKVYLRFLQRSFRLSSKLIGEDRATTLLLVAHRITELESHENP